MDTDGQTLNLTETLTDLSLVDSVSEPVPSQSNPDLQSYELTFNINPYDIEAIEFIPELRTIVEKEIEAAGISDAKEKVWISGQTATEYDKKQTVKRDEFTIFPIIIVLISLLLISVFAFYYQR